MTTSTTIVSTPANAVSADAPQRDYILLDASGSMCSRWWESLDAIDSYIAGLKANNVRSRVKLATFTSIGTDLQYDIGRDTDVAGYQNCTEASPVMYSGGTPLYDAINRMVRDLKDDRPGSIVIVTDGEENASKTSLVQAKSLLDWARARGWQIIFMGCDWDNSRQARLLGAADGASVGTSAKRLTDAARELATKRAHHAHYGKPMEFTKDEQAKFGGYLTSGK
jgi:Mg-chelatase subunit ChlD